MKLVAIAVAVAGVFAPATWAGQQARFRRVRSRRRPRSPSWSAPGRSLMVGGLDRPQPESTQAAATISAELNGCLLHERVVARTGNPPYEALVLWGVNGPDGAVQRVLVHSQHGRFGVYQGRRNGSELPLVQQPLGSQPDATIVEHRVVFRDRDHFQISQPDVDRPRRDVGGAVALGVRTALRPLGALLEQEREQRLLRVQPVLRLIEHHRRRALDHVADTSSPRCAGRQCMKIASGLGVRHQRVVHLVARERARAARRPRPPGPSTSRRRCRPRRRAAHRLARVREQLERSRRGGDARHLLAARASAARSRPARRRARSCPASRTRAPATSRRCCRRRRRRWSRPASVSKRSRSVSRSASAWHGCSSSVSAFTTRSDGAADANSSTVCCANVRMTTASTQRSRLRATSDGRLARAERHVGRDQHRRAAELADRHLERHARAQRRLVEEQRDVPAGQRRERLTARPPRARS